MNQREATDESTGSGRQDVHGRDLPSVQVLRRIEADRRQDAVAIGAWVI